MLKLKKALALLTVCVMALTLTVVPAMAEESLAPTLLQYEDFVYGAWKYDVNENPAGFDLAYMNNAKNNSDTAKGFSSGWTLSNGGEVVAGKGWNLYTQDNHESYTLKSTKYSNSDLQRTVSTEKQINLDAEGYVYNISWEQYFAKGAMATGNESVYLVFRKANGETPIFKAGIKTTNNTKRTRLNFVCDATGETWGADANALTAETTYRILMQIKANPAGTKDVITMKAYPVNGLPGSTWDLTKEIDLTGSLDLLMVDSTLSNASSTSSDVRLGNYWVEAFDNSNKISALSSAQTAINALGTATEDNVDELNYVAKKAIQKLGATNSAEVLTSELTSVLSANDLTPAEIYKAKTLQYEDFNYGIYNTEEEPTGRNILNFPASKGADEEKGFKTGWYRGDNAELAGSEGWYIYTPDSNESYQLKTSTNTVSQIKRDVLEANQIDLDKEGIYYITFEQYLDEGTTSPRGAFLTLREDDSSTEGVYEHFKIGMKTTNKGLTRMDMYVNPLLEGETWGTADRLYNFGKMHEVVVKIVSHPAGTKDEVYAMMYPKGSTPVDWDVWNISMTNKELSGKLDMVSFQAPNTGVADIRFADYNVDFFEDEAIDEFKATETALGAIATKLAIGEAADNEIIAAQAQIAKLATDCNTKEQWTEILNVYSAQNAVVKEVNSANITTQEEYNALQNKVCLLPGNLMTKGNDGTIAEVITSAGRMKAALQAKLDAIAANGSFAQYIWNATYTEGAGTINKDSIVSAQIKNSTSDKMIIAAYNADDILITTQICSGEKVEYTVGAASYIKVFTWDSSSLAPKMNAILYVK